MEFAYRPIDGGNPCVVQIQDEEIERVAKEIAIAEAYSRGHPLGCAPDGRLLQDFEQAEIAWPMYRYHAARAIAAVHYKRPVPAKSMRETLEDYQKYQGREEMRLQQAD